MWACSERNTDKYLERELFVDPSGGEERHGGRGETDGGPGSVISGVAVVVNT